MDDTNGGTTPGAGPLAEGSVVNVPFMPTLAGPRPFIWSDATALLRMVPGMVDVCLVRNEYVLTTQSGTLTAPDDEGAQMMLTGAMNGQPMMVDAGRVRMNGQAAVDLALSILEMNAHEGFVSADEVKAKAAQRSINLG